jgi:tetratricopeptide (TPR) repeat protein
MELSFAQALEANKAIKLSALNDGFADPRLISLAYYQASLVVEHLAAVYGEPALHQFIRAYGRGLETDEALKAAFNITVDQLQTSFDEKIARDFAPHRAALKAPELPGTPTLDALKLLAVSNPGSFKVQMELAQALHEAGDAPAALAALERASALLPSATGSDNPNALIALIATEQGDSARAIQALQALLKVDHTDVESARKLLGLLEKGGDAARIAAVSQIISDLDPFDAAAQARVGRHALQNRDAAGAVRHLRSALAANPPDRASAHLYLGEAYFLAGQMGDAKVQALAALELAPSFERAQDLLLKIVDVQTRGGGQ